MAPGALSFCLRRGLCQTKGCGGVKGFGGGTCLVGDDALGLAVWGVCGVRRSARARERERERDGVGDARIISATAAAGACGGAICRMGGGVVAVGLATVDVCLAGKGQVTALFCLP